MKDSLKPMVSKEVKELKKKILEQWGCSPELDYQLFISSKQKIYLINRDITRIDLSRLKINSVGLYFAELKGELRLSIEGSQLIGPEATKNIVEISEQQMKDWFLGKDLEDIEGDYSGFVILKHKNDFLGTGKFKDSTILNFVPKARRFTSKDLP